MNDGYHDMPPLVDSQRFDGSAPMMINNQSSWPSNDSFPGHPSIAAQPQSWSPGLAYFNPSQWPGWEAQAGATPLSWGSSMASTPPMMTGAPMAVMPLNLGIHSDGWPRPLAGREPKQENGLPWKNYDDDFDQSPSAHSKTPLSRSVSLSSSPSSASLHRGGSLSRKASIGLHGHAAEALKRPPREWRADFTLVGNGLLSGLLGTRSRSKSLGGGANGEWLRLASSRYRPLGGLSSARFAARRCRSSTTPYLRPRCQESFFTRSAHLFSTFVPAAVSHSMPQLTPTLLSPRRRAKGHAAPVHPLHDLLQGPDGPRPPRVPEHAQVPRAQRAVAHVLGPHALRLRAAAPVHAPLSRTAAVVHRGRNAEPVWGDAIRHVLRHQPVHDDADPERGLLQRRDVLGDARTGRGRVGSAMSQRGGAPTGNPPRRLPHGPRHHGGHPEG